MTTRFFQMQGLPCSEQDTILITYLYLQCFLFFITRKHRKFTTRPLIKVVFLLGVWSQTFEILITSQILNARWYHLSVVKRLVKHVDILRIRPVYNVFTTFSPRSRRVVPSAAKNNEVTYDLFYLVSTLQSVNRKIATFRNVTTIVTGPAPPSPRSTVTVLLVSCKTRRIAYVTRTPQTAPNSDKSPHKRLQRCNRGPDAGGETLFETSCYPRNFAMPTNARARRRRDSLVCVHVSRTVEYVIRVLSAPSLIKLLNNVFDDKYELKFHSDEPHASCPVIRHTNSPRITSLLPIAYRFSRRYYFWYTHVCTAVFTVTITKTFIVTIQTSMSVHICFWSVYSMRGALQVVMCFQVYKYLSVNCFEVFPKSFGHCWPISVIWHKKKKKLKHEQYFKLFLLNIY